jgi:hypothetical protein
LKHSCATSHEKHEQEMMFCDVRVVACHSRILNPAAEDPFPLRERSRLQFTPPVSGRDIPRGYPIETKHSGQVTVFLWNNWNNRRHPCLTAMIAIA